MNIYICVCFSRISLPCWYHISDHAKSLVIYVRVLIWESVRERVSFDFAIGTLHVKDMPDVLYNWCSVYTLYIKLSRVCEKYNHVSIRKLSFLFFLFFWFWQYLTRGLVWHLSTSSIRPSSYFNSIVKSRSNPFLELTSTKQ